MLARLRGHCLASGHCSAGCCPPCGLVRVGAEIGNCCYPRSAQPLPLWAPGQCFSKCSSCDDFAMVDFGPASRGVCLPLGMSPLLALDICPCPALPLHFFLSHRGDWVRPPTPLLPPRNRFSSPWVRGFSVWSCSNHALFTGSQLAAGPPDPRARGGSPLWAVQAS